MTSKAFKKLFEPGKIGEMQVRNRIVMPAMLNNFGTPDGYVTEQTKAYYEARSKGGAGLIIVESTTVDHRLSRIGPRQLAVDDDRFIPGLRELARVIQKHGAKACLQLQHAGSEAMVEVTQVQPVAPSAVAKPGRTLPRELTASEIDDLVNRFAKGAQRGKEAGFDAIEVHGAHGYIISQFLSSAWNKRQDKYGGELNNRARFLLEILAAIRAVVGKSYPVWCRINGEETRAPGGITLGEAQELAKILEAAGSDALNVSASDPYLPSPRPYFYPPGWAMHLAAGVKQVVKVPVMAVGRISPEMGERLLQDGKADFIIMGRALRADPELPQKVASGRLNEIRPCLACDSCLAPSRPAGESLCAVNAAKGREREYQIIPANKSKQVLVVGGGPAGMEAARVATLRGHSVTLLAEEPRLGGLLNIASLISPEIYKFNNYLISQITKLGVKVILGKKATPSLIERLNPEAIILAAGANPLPPSIPGINRGNVLSSTLLQAKASDQLKKLLSFKRGITSRQRLWALGAIPSRLLGVSFGRWMLKGGIGFGKRIVVIGSELPGCEMAEFFNEKGKQVTMVELPQNAIAGTMPKPMPILKGYLLSRLAERGVSILTDVKIDEVTPEGLVISNKDGKRLIPADTVILTSGSRPNSDLPPCLKDKPYEIYVAGDCNRPAGILEAVDDGFRIARMV